MPVIAKRSPKLRFQFITATKESPLGGLPALEALAQQFGLWKKIRALPGIDPRTRTSHGYSPELIVAQLLYCLCSGGASLADAERLNDEPLVRELARVKKFADQTQLGEWLRGQSDGSIVALWKLIGEFVAWVVERAEAPRWTYAGRAEVFFDDTQIEVHGPSFEGATINYEGNLALSWQTFWLGSFLLAAELGSPGEVSSALPGFCRLIAPCGQSGPVISWPTALPAARPICAPSRRPASPTGVSVTINGPAVRSARRRRCRKGFGVRPAPRAGATARKSASNTPTCGIVRRAVSLASRWPVRVGRKTTRCSVVTRSGHTMGGAPTRPP